MKEKMESLLKMFGDTVLTSSKVFIVGHDDSDYDSIGSAIGLSELCHNFGIESYIIVNDNDMELESGVKQIIDKEKEKYNIINLNKFLELKDNASALIVTDTSVSTRVSVRDYLDSFKNILIIDHHDESSRTIDTLNKYIDTNTSSASEIVTNLLEHANVKYSPETASYLLSGIRLDTKGFYMNMSEYTHKTMQKLEDKGANSDYVNELFLSEFDEYQEISLLISNNGNTEFESYEDLNNENNNQYNVSYTLNRIDPMQNYKKIVFAKAADEMMMKIRYTDASFAIGHTNPNTIWISGRSKGKVDVGEVLRQMDGGGNIRSAGCKIYLK